MVGSKLAPKMLGLCGSLGKEGCGGNVSPAQPTVLEFDNVASLAACKVRISSYRPNRQECCMLWDERGSMAARSAQKRSIQCAALKSVSRFDVDALPASHVESSMMIRSHLEGLGSL